MSLPSALRLPIVLVLAVGLTGCFLTGASLPSVSGDFVGQIAIQGQAVSGTLRVDQEAEALTATFEAPSFGLVAEGSGTVSGDGTIALSLEYDLQCPGVARLSGDVSADGRRLEGRIEAEDCTGPVAGTFEFSR